MAMQVPSFEGNRALSAMPRMRSRIPFRTRPCRMYLLAKFLPSNLAKMVCAKRVFGGLCIEKEVSAVASGTRAPGLYKYLQPGSLKPWKGSRKRESFVHNS